MTTKRFPQFTALREQVPQEPNVGHDDIQLYTQGFCHVYAIANVLAWGGAFLIVENPNDTYALDADEEPIVSIWHVMSVHDTDKGPIARDILGDRPLDDVTPYICDLFDCDPEDTSSHITPNLDEVLERTDLAETLFGTDPDTCPLCGFEPHDLAQAANTGPSLFKPGTVPGRDRNPW